MTVRHSFFVGLMVGAASTVVIVSVLQRRPGLSFLEEDLRRPTHAGAIVAYEKLKQWSQSFPGQDDNTHRVGDVIVFPDQIDPVLVRGGVFASMTIAVRPFGTGTEEQAAEAWAATPVAERKAVYGKICSAAANGIAEAVRIAPERVTVGFVASRARPAATMPTRFPLDSGNYAKTTLQMIAEGGEKLIDP